MTDESQADRLMRRLREALEAAGEPVRTIQEAVQAHIDKQSDGSSET